MELIDMDFNLKHLKLRCRKAQAVPDGPFLFLSLKGLNWKCKGRKPFQTVWIRFTEPGQVLFEGGLAACAENGAVQAQKTPIRGFLSVGGPC